MNRHSAWLLAFATFEFGIAGPARAQAVADGALARRADSLFRAQDYRAAADAYRRLTSADTTAARWWAQLGMSSALLGDYRAGAAAFRHASANGGNPAAAYNTGAMYARLAMPDSAFVWLSRALRTGFVDTATLAHDDDIASLRADPRFSALRASVARAIAPCSSDSLYRRFDFWVGTWRVTNAAGNEAGHSEVQVVSGGCALLENWYDTRGAQGKSLNTYDPAIGEWRQFWVGQFGGMTDYARSEWHDQTLTFYAAHGTPTSPTQRLSFTPVDANTVRQHGESSTDGGKTWATTYDFLYHRIP